MAYNVDLGDLAYGIGGLITQGSNTRRESGAVAPNNFDAQYAQLSQQLQQLTGQLANSTNPEFQSRVSAKTDQIMRSFEQAIRAQAARQEAIAARTGSSRVNPERRDEALSRSLAQARVQAESQARAEVTNEMLTAARASAEGARVAGTGAVQQRAAQTAGANAQNRGNTARNAGILQIASALAGPLLGKVDLSKLGETIAQNQQQQGQQPSRGATSAVPAVARAAGGGFPNAPFIHPNAIPNQTNTPSLSPPDYTNMVGGGDDFSNAIPGMTQTPSIAPPDYTSMLGGGGDFANALPEPTFSPSTAPDDYSAMFGGGDNFDWMQNALPDETFSPSFAPEDYTDIFSNFGTGFDFGNLDYGSFF